MSGAEGLIVALTDDGPAVARSAIWRQSSSCVEIEPRLSSVHWAAYFAASLRVSLGMPASQTSTTQDFV